MKKFFIRFFSLLSSISFLLAGCSASHSQQTIEQNAPSAGHTNSVSQSSGLDGSSQREPISLTHEIIKLEDGLEAVRFDGDYGFSNFLAQGGASSDSEVIEYLAHNLLGNLNFSGIINGLFGCSTLAATSPTGDALFGRNFDWNTCNAMVVAAYPHEGYASISTVNMDFITQGAGKSPGGMALKMDQVRTLAALYAPLDGMNEAGLAVSVNMIQDHADINQNTGKPGITTTTAIRLLLDQASSTGEALDLLKQYDMHASMGMMVHFAIADRSGRHVAVEYVNNEMIVTETSVLTNFYLAEGEKNGIGTQQSHERFQILTDLITQNETMTETDVRDALSRVSKGNFGEFESTEWSIVMNLATGEALYYHRENYQNQYLFAISRRLSK